MIIKALTGRQTMCSSYSSLLHLYGTCGARVFYFRNIKIVECIEKISLIA